MVNVFPVPGGPYKMMFDKSLGSKQLLTPTCIAALASPLFSDASSEDANFVSSISKSCIKSSFMVESSLYIKPDANNSPLLSMKMRILS